MSTHQCQHTSPVGCHHIIHTQTLAAHGMGWRHSSINACDLLHAANLHRQGVWGYACPCGPLGHHALGRGDDGDPEHPPLHSHMCNGWQVSSNHELLASTARAYVQGQHSIWQMWWQDGVHGQRDHGQRDDGQRDDGQCDHGQPNDGQSHPPDETDAAAWPVFRAVCG